LAEDREGIWIGTSNGAFYFDGRDLVLNPVPIDKLPDVVVNTIYVDSTTNAVWFGTAGGLTVWHRPNQATSVAPRPVGARAVPATYQNQGLVINPLGRKVSSFGHSAAGLNLLRLPNGAVVKNMNLNRLMR